jgi:hypothetical protein
MFQTTSEDSKVLMLQFATSKKGRGGRRKLPLVFTEHGAIMASSVLNSVQVARPLPASRMLHIQYQPPKKPFETRSKQHSCTNASIRISQKKPASCCQI